MVQNEVDLENFRYLEVVFNWLFVIHEKVSLPEESLAS